MVVSRKFRNRKKIFIAVGIAALIGMVLLGLVHLNIIYNQQKDITIKDLNQKLTHVVKQNQDLTNENMVLKEPKQPATLVSQNVSIIVAKEPIEAGTELNQDNLTIINKKQEDLPDDYQTDLHALSGRIAKIDINSGEIIESKKLLEADMNALKISKGFRALTINSNLLSGIGSLVNTGSRLDIYTIMLKPVKNNNLKDPKTQEKIAKLLIKNVKVIDVSGNSINKQNDKSPSGQTITLAIPNEQVTKLVLAFNENNNAIQAVVRNARDTVEISKTSMDTDELITGIPAKVKNKFSTQINLPKPQHKENYKTAQNSDLNSIINTNDILPLPESPKTATNTRSIEYIQGSHRSEVSFETEM